MIRYLPEIINIVLVSQYHIIIIVYVPSFYFVSEIRDYETDKKCRKSSVKRFLECRLRLIYKKNIIIILLYYHYCGEK